MSIRASLFRGLYRALGIKKLFALPEDEILKVIAKQNRNRGFYMPTDHKAFYEKKVICGSLCLVVRQHQEPSRRAILFFFGGGMVIGPDKGDIPVLRKLCFGTGCDIWFPCYPLCTDHCITETYEMAFECYRQMVALYGSGNVSTCGFSSGGTLALGVAATTAPWAHPCLSPGILWRWPPGRCSMAHCRNLRTPAAAPTSPIPSSPAPAWCTATACSPISPRPGRTSTRSSRF